MNMFSYCMAPKENNHIESIKGVNNIYNVEIS